MFVPFWLIYLATGTVMAVVTLVWAIKHRQFEEQDRARYLPLAGLTAEELASPPPVRHGPSLYGLLAIFLVGALALALGLSIVMKYAG